MKKYLLPWEFHSISKSWRRKNANDIEHWFSVVFDRGNEVWYAWDKDEADYVGYETVQAAMDAMDNSLSKMGYTFLSEKMIVLL